MVLDKTISETLMDYLNLLQKNVLFSGINYTNIRPHNIYGLNMGYNHVIPELIKKYIKTKKWVSFHIIIKGLLLY